MVDASGRTFSWGLGAFGQLGHGKLSDEPRPRVIEALLQAGRAFAVGCGQQHTAVLLKPSPPTRPDIAAPDVTSAVDGGCNSGVLYGFGHAEWGQLGEIGFVGASDGGQASPRRIPLPAEMGPAVGLDCGALHNLVLDAHGQVWTFGWGASGALCHGNTQFVLESKCVTSLQGKHLVGVAGGAKHSVLLEASDSDSGESRWHSLHLAQ